MRVDPEDRFERALLLEQLESKKYDADALPPVEGPGSRYDRSHSPAGWAVPRGETTAARWLDLADKARREAPAKLEPVRRVPLFRLGRTPSGEARLVPWGFVEAVPTAAAEVPPRHGSVNGLSGGSVIDSFLEKGEAWKKLRDSAIWNALLEWAVATRPSVQALRSTADAVSVGILTRHGLPFSVVELWSGSRVQKAEAA